MEEPNSLHFLVENLDEAQCAICERKDNELMLISEYDRETPADEVSLENKLLSLSNNKPLPTEGICNKCVWTAKDAWNFQQKLLAANREPSLSDKVRILRQRLKQLTQKVDVFVVVGPENSGENGNNSALYSEDNVIMIDKNIPDDPLTEEYKLNENNIPEKVYECSICHLDFSSRHACNAHLQTHPDDSPHACRECNKTFPSRGKWLDHKIKHRKNESRGCNQCHRLFRTVGELRRHVCDLCCPACQLTFDDRSDLSNHIRDNHGIPSKRKPYACHVCLQMFEEDYELSSHLKTHDQTKQFVCALEGCIMRFSTRVGLLMHIRKTHSKGGALKCSMCKESFGTTEDLREHQQYVHRCIECEVCKRQFATVPALKRHQRVHDPNRKSKNKNMDIKIKSSPEHVMSNQGLNENDLAVDGEEDMQVEMLEEDIEYLEMEELDGEEDALVSDDEKPDISTIYIQ